MKQPKIKLEPFQVELPTGETLAVYRTEGDQIFGIDGSWLEQNEGQTHYYGPIGGDKWEIDQEHEDALVVETLKLPNRFFFLFADEDSIEYFRKGGVPSFIKNVIKRGEPYNYFRSSNALTVATEVMLYGCFAALTDLEFRSISSSQ